MFIFIKFERPLIQYVSTCAVLAMNLNDTVFTYTINEYVHIHSLYSMLLLYELKGSYSTH